MAQSLKIELKGSNASLFNKVGRRGEVEGNAFFASVTFLGTKKKGRKIKRQIDRHKRCYVFQRYFLAVLCLAVEIQFSFFDFLNFVSLSLCLSVLFLTFNLKSCPDLEETVPLRIKK